MTFFSIISLCKSNHKDIVIFKTRIFAFCVSILAFTFTVTVLSYNGEKAVCEKASTEDLEKLEFLYKNSDEYIKNTCSKYIIKDLSQKYIVYFSVIKYEECFNKIKKERDIEKENKNIEQKNKQFEKYLLH